MRSIRFALTCGALALLSGLQARAACPRDQLQLWELCYWPAAGQPQWVEIKNLGAETTDCAGMEVQAGGGAYAIPASMEAVPANGIILIYFDGASPTTDDNSFAGDGRAVLHAPLPAKGGFLGNPAGWCRLCRVAGACTVDTVLDFVAWGAAAGAEATEAVAKRLWPGETNYIQTRGEAIGPDSEVMSQGGSLYRLASLGWDTAGAAYVTPGSDTVPPLLAPRILSPTEGLRTLDPPPSLWWEAVTAADSYDCQIADDEGFSHVVRSGTLSQTQYDIDPPLALDSKYWWRVRSRNGDVTSDWSLPTGFTVGFPTEPAPKEVTEPKKDEVAASGKETTYSVSGTVTETVDGVVRPLGGLAVTIAGRNGNTAANGTFSVAGLPNGTHAIAIVQEGYTFAPPTVAVAGANVAGLAIIGTGASRDLAVAALGARKDTNMLAIKPGATSKVMCDKTGTNNQRWDGPNPRATHSANDLESWWCWAVGATMLNHFYGGDICRDEVVLKVKGDLLHDIDAGASWANCRSALEFALGAAVSLTNHEYSSAPKPNATVFVAELAAGRPIYYAKPGHIMVVSGYKYQQKECYFKFLNTRNNGGHEWWAWSTAPWAGAFLVSNPTAKSTDAKLGSDADSDGVTDFDEGGRFPCSAADSDSDDDGIPDKAEIMSWVFPRESTGKSKLDTTGAVFNVADVDGDGLAPEVDEDSDDGGLKDGEEDKNHDAVWDKGAEETDVFDLKDDGLLDLVFCIDTTGSMGDDIGQVKVNAVQIVNKAEEKYPSFRIAVIDYRDFPDRTDYAADYPARTQLDFSSDKPAIVSAINGLSLGYGGDYEETVYSGVVHAIDNLSGWREKAKRMIVIMGDAPALDPEPNTGYTLFYVAAKAFLGGIRFTSGVKQAPGKEVTRSGPVAVYTVPTAGGATSTFRALAEETGGTMISAPSPSDVPDALIAAIEIAKSQPIAELEVTGTTGSPQITADASRSRDPYGCGIVTYDWDWDGDGTYDETSVDPVKTHTFGAGGFPGTMRVKVTNFAGTASVAVFIAGAEDIVGEVTDVTPYVTVQWASPAQWTVNPRTGTISGSVSITNNGGSPKGALRTAFWYAVPETARVRLMHPDGTLEDGTPYVDITDLVEAALPGVGNGDLNLDPGETVTIEGIEFYSYDRTAPLGHVFAVWADPPAEAGASAVAEEPAPAAGPALATVTDLAWYASFWHGTDQDSLNTVVVGGAAAATDAADAGFDLTAEAGSTLWSTPADLQTPLLRQDVRPAALANSWLLGTAAGAGPVQFSWTRSDLPEGLMLVLTQLGAGGQALPETRIEVTCEGTTALTGGAGLAIDLDEEVLLELRLAPGWNLVSFPMNPVPGAVSPWLATLPAESLVLRFENGGYVPALELNALEGLWVFTPGEVTVPVKGLVVSDAVLNLKYGWNLIGVPVECLPPACIAGAAWEWRGNTYIPAGRLVPGRAYFVFATRDQAVPFGDPQGW